MRFSGGLICAKPKTSCEAFCFTGRLLILNNTNTYERVSVFGGLTITGKSTIIMQINSYYLHAAKPVCLCYNHLAAA